MTVALAWIGTRADYWIVEPFERKFLRPRKFGYRVGLDDGDDGEPAPPSN
jgi:hypothetical protein